MTFAMSGYECSTPFGIRGENSPQESTTQSRLGFVLNAFRHQRGKQVDCDAGEQGKRRSAQRLSASEGKTAHHGYGYPPPARCSTPFGIRGENRRGCVEMRRRQVGAQRLSASEGKTATIHYNIHLTVVVLNAFRHQRGKQFAGVL